MNQQKGSLDMKSCFAVLSLGVLLTLAGCNQGISGGPGAATPPPKAPMVVQPEDTFSMSAPSTKLNQGESKAVSIGISRGKNFSGDVALILGNLPKGVTFVPASPVIRQADAEAVLTFTATADAAPGDFKVLVTGHPAKGPDTPTEFNLAVMKQEPKNAANATLDAAKAKWDEYTVAAQKEWDHLSAKLADLKDRAAKAQGQAKTDLDKKLVEVKAKMDALAVKMEDMKSAGADRWEKVKEGMSNAFDDLKTMFE